jgi:hypothetical protein
MTLSLRDAALIGGETGRLLKDILASHEVRMKSMLGPLERRLAASEGRLAALEQVRAGQRRWFVSVGPDPDDATQLRVLLDNGDYTIVPVQDAQAWPRLEGRA